MSEGKSALLSVTKLKSETVDIDGVRVVVSEIGAADWIKLWTADQYQTDGAVDMSKFTPALLAYALVDEDGKRMFTDAEIPDVSRMSQEPFLKLADVAKRLNGLTGVDTEIKNSDPSQTDSLLGEFA